MHVDLFGNTKKIKMEKVKNKLVVLIPFYNPGKFLERCVSSVVSQNYENFKMIFIDDASTDGSWNKLPHNDKRAICIRNEKNVTALQNLHNAIMEYCEDDDIIITLDGDDSLIGKNCLNQINNFFNETGCWVSYGQCIWSTGQRGFASWYSPEEFSNLRFSPFKVSHIRTFRAGVYHRIQDQDPSFSCMKDNDGNFYRSCYDVAIMFPIMELSGYDKVKYNDKVLYMYNFENPISDHRVDQALQTGIHIEVSKKPRFRQIKNYKKLATTE